jgi:glycosyltransferase involved in cell wall biosynthesis
MPAYLGQLDILVLPSRTSANWKEQFGRILVEAMACEVTVIGSDSGEIPNVIGEAGLIFAEDNVEELYNHLLTLLKDDILRRRLGRLGRERVLNHYTQEQIAAKTVDVYREMMADG